MSTVLNMPEQAISSEYTLTYINIEYVQPCLNIVCSV